MDDWDVVVVGAGPAGATAALAALSGPAGPAGPRDPGSPRPRVLLLDRADFPRDKCCGDGIAPHVLDVLARYGAADVVEGWAPVERLALARRDRRVHGAMARPGHVIPRQVFDARLVERAVAAGATLRRHRVRSVRVAEDGRVVLDEQLRARVVVGADGAHSVVRAALGTPAPRRTALAIRGYAPTPPERAGRQVIRFGERRQPSYAWAFDRGDGLSNVGYGELVGDGSGDGDPPTRALMLAELEDLLPGTVEDGGSWRAHHLPLSGRGWRGDQPDGPVLLAGDAAGLINPLTGEGIYYAVTTGALAGTTAVAVLRDGHPEQAGARHRAAVRRRLDRHLQHTWAAAHLSRHPRLLEAGLVASARDAGAFDDLVELGLGEGRITPRLAGGLLRGLLSRPVPARPAPREARA